MNRFDFHDEMIQIEMLFQSRIISFGYKEYSLETFADRGFFQNWKANEGCRDTDEMRASLNLDGILKSDAPSDGEVLTYLQYVLNIAELCRRSFNASEEEGYDFDIRNYTELLSKIRALLKDLRYDVQYVAEKDFLFIVPHDAAAEAVSAVADDPLSAAITEYRALPEAENLNGRRELLKKLGSEIESYPDNLKPENARLYSRIEFLLNNISIRYDNTEGDEEIERVSAMDAAEMSGWYDETFQLLLLRILQHENEERMERVDGLAEECGMPISTVTENEIEGILEDFREEEAKIRAMDTEDTQDGAGNDKDESSVEDSDTAGSRTSGRHAASSENGEAELLADGIKTPAKGNDGTRKVILSVLIAVALFAVFLIIYYLYFNA